MAAYMVSSIKWIPLTALSGWLLDIGKKNCHEWEEHCLSAPSCYSFPFTCFSLFHSPQEYSFSYVGRKPQLINPHLPRTVFDTVYSYQLKRKDLPLQRPPPFQSLFRKSIQLLPSPLLSLYILFAIPHRCLRTLPLILSRRLGEFGEFSTWGSGIGRWDPRFGHTSTFVHPPVSFPSAYLYNFHSWDYFSALVGMALATWSVWDVLAAL